MSFKWLLALALIAPVVANAQTKQTQPVTVEIVGTGSIDALASRITASLSYSVKGTTEAEAEKALTSRRGEIMAAVQAAGVPLSAFNVTAKDDTTEVEIISDEMDGAKGEDKPEVHRGETASLKLTSMGQLLAIKKALGEHEVTWGAIEPELDDIAAVEREAKAKALAASREDALVYANALGLRPVRVVKISEAGNGIFMPGMQRMFQQMMNGGPAAMRMMMQQRSSGTVRVEVSIVVEYQLAP